MGVNFKYLLFFKNLDIYYNCIYMALFKNIVFVKYFLEVILNMCFFVFLDDMTFKLKKNIAKLVFLY